MRCLILNALIAGIHLNSSKTNLPEPVLNAKEQFAIVKEIMVVVSGVHLHLPTQEIFAPNSEGQSQDILGTMCDCLAKDFHGLYPGWPVPVKAGLSFST